MSTALLDPIQKARDYWSKIVLNPSLGSLVGIVFDDFQIKIPLVASLSMHKEFISIGADGGMFHSQCHEMSQDAKLAILGWIMYLYHRRQNDMRNPEQFVDVEDQLIISKLYHELINFPDGRTPPPSNQMYFKDNKLYIFARQQIGIEYQLFVVSPDGKISDQSGAPVALNWYPAIAGLLMVLFYGYLTMDARVKFIP